MYFPTGSARVFSVEPSCRGNADPIISITASPHKYTFATLSRDALWLWRGRPPIVLAHLTRSLVSLAEHGSNKHVIWSPDANRLVIQTTQSYLILVVVHYFSAPSEVTPKLSIAAQRQFQPGPGEGQPQSASLHIEGIMRVEGNILGFSPRSYHIYFSTESPPAIQRIPWPLDDENASMEEEKRRLRHDTWLLNDQDFPWLKTVDVTIDNIVYSPNTGGETWITSDGRVYFAYITDDGQHTASSLKPTNSSQKLNDPEGVNGTSVEGAQALKPLQWRGTCIHDVREQRSTLHSQSTLDYQKPDGATCTAINSFFSLIAVGTKRGNIEIANFPSHSGASPKVEILSFPFPHLYTGETRCMAWSSDGYALAIGWENGWSVWSIGGRCLAWALGAESSVNSARFQDSFMQGIDDMFWLPGNYELIVLAKLINTDGNQLFSIPFAKSAVTGQHTPDNTRYAFLQMDDRVLVYRGADQPDMSVINPESDVWQSIKIPLEYVKMNWPIRYASISNDGRLIGVAGRRGLAHYSASSGRWKTFSDPLQEQAFIVKGGLVWFHHVLIAAVDVSKSYQIRLYSRDLDLANQNVLHREVLKSSVVLLSLVDNSLLVYTADNTLMHYLIIPTNDSIKLHFCGSISFADIVAVPNVVRGMSWMIPDIQKQLGDPVDDLIVATILLLVGGKLVLLRPRKSGIQEVKYDMQILADRIEFCWIHLRGIGSLENSLWGYDGQGIRLWLDALTIEAVAVDPKNDTYESVQESVNITLDFYPLSVLMDKGIIIGVEEETVTRPTLPFVMFRIVTSTHLFLHHVLRFHLRRGQVREAVQFAAHYQNLVFFTHALEVLLHTVIEEEIESEDGTTSSDESLLSPTVEFLDHFDAALEVVVGCARKTEMARWPRLFNIVGNPKSLFESCLSSNLLTTAGSYLLVLHNLEQLNTQNDEIVRLLRRAIDTKKWILCRDLLRFLRSIDLSGRVLQHVLTQIDPPALDEWMRIMSLSVDIIFYITATQSCRVGNRIDIHWVMDQEIQFNHEGAVIIPYNSLTSNPNSLQASIAKGFGSDLDCLGLVIVTGLPEEFKLLREKLLLLGDQFASLPESTREKYADQNSKYSFGWSHGKEIMNGRPDTMKGSFYANPVLDEPDTTLEQKLKYPEYYSHNIWPTEDGIEDFEGAFKSLGSFIFQVGRKLANACQPFAASHLVNQALFLPDLISPNTTKARLLHYFPPPPGKSMTDDGAVDSWCGYHLDHSLITGLCSAMYIHHQDGEKKICSPPSLQSGLYIRTRGGDLIKVSIPPDCLAFQTGEALELATNGRLRATPHCVRVGSGPEAEYISRETFVLFMQPDIDVQIGSKDTFGSLTKRVLNEHYENLSRTKT